MSVTFQQSIANDVSLAVDNLEQIAIQLRRNIPETVTVQHANRSQMSRQLASFANVSIEADQVPFLFQANEFSPMKNAAELRHLDVITDATGNQYTVQRATLMTLETVWLVITTRKNP